jgi:acyl carrier protein
METRVDKLDTIFRDVFEDPTLETKGLTRQNFPDWDSLAHVKLVLGIEETLNVKLSFDEVARVSSIEEFRRLIADKESL